MRYSIEKISQAQKLRTKGYSIPEISKLCSIPKTTVLRQVKNIKIDQKYIRRWRERRNSSKRLSKLKWLEADKRAEKIVGNLSRRDLALIASMLYWAEGTKRDFNFSNTDPAMIEVFIAILRAIFKVKDSDFKISIRIYEDLNKKSCIHYWSKVTGLNLERKVSINILEGSKNGKLKYGMCRIRVKKADRLHKELFSIANKLVYKLAPVVQRIERRRPKP